MDQKLMLIILDGWGIATNPQHSAIDQAKTPFIDSLYQQYPHSKLQASGLSVGLPQGQMGNSEVGHLNLGAGRVVYQTLLRINEAIEKKTLHQHQALLAAIDYAKKQKKKFHCLGLLSDGGVHSHINHLKAICSIAHDHGLDNLFIHAFTDGRDTALYTAPYFLKDLTNHLQQSTGQLASIMGRYYAMDRDHRWERIQVAYDALVYGKGEQIQDWQAAIDRAYENGITDEFLQPIVLASPQGTPIACIEKGDVVLCFNFRPDRSRQLTQVLTQAPLPHYQMPPLNLQYLTFTNYDNTFKNIQVFF